MNQVARQTVMFASITEKPILVKFNQPAQSSDAGVVLLRQADEQLHLTEQLADALHDKRQESKVRHELLEMIRQRVYGIGCGYFDCGDSARIANDPVMKITCGSGQAQQQLASQPTLCRFENAFKSTDLLRTGYAFMDAVISKQKQKRWRRKPRLITVDIDPTDDPTYGNQQLTFFNAHYDNYCYLPAVATIQFDKEKEQHLVAIVLRPGNSKGSKDLICILSRLLERLRAAFGDVRIIVRLDGEFAAPAVFDYLDSDEHLGYLVNQPINSVLERLAEPLMKEVRALSAKSGQTQRRYGEFHYAAQTWSCKRRIIFKAERLLQPGREPKDNCRFVTTNLDWTKRNTYEWYCKRGDSENRIKELLNDLRMDLTSCSSFLANQLRCILTGATYALYQQLRQNAADTQFESAQVQSLRERLIKVAAVVVQSVRRIVLQLPQEYPWKESWLRIALNCGAEAG